jgi:hypothetical protein
MRAQGHFDFPGAGPHALPDVALGAVPTWGTNKDDRTALTSNNIHVLQQVEDINEICGGPRCSFRRCGAEARDQIIVEAMLPGFRSSRATWRGIREAKLPA